MKVQHLFLYCLLIWVSLSCKKTEEPVIPKSTGKAITASPSVDGLAGATVSYDAVTFTYTINVSAGTDIKALKLSIPISPKATISPDPTTARDYTNPVQYTITAEDGSKQVYTVKAVKAAAPPTASFTVQNNGCTASCNITFTNTSTNANSYTWTFGDGTQATDQNAAKQYTAPGSYTVTLRASGAGGTATAQQSITVLGSTISAEPSMIWDKSFGGNSGDGMSSMIATSDGGFLMGGTSRSGNSGNKTTANAGGTDYWIVRIDAGGNKLWEKTFGGLGDENLQGIVATPDGGFILAGNSQPRVISTTPSLDLLDYDYWVVKINASGDKIWDKNYGGIKNDILTSILINPDGSFLLGGYSDSPATNSKTVNGYGYSDYWVVKINANGDKIWDKIFGGANYDSLSEMIVTSDGGFLLCGSSDSAISGNKTSVVDLFDYDYWVVKINANGDKVWDKAFGGGENDVLTSAITTTDGGFILAGGSNSFPSQTSFRDDYYVVKINANGNMIWNKVFGGTREDTPYSVIATNDGGFLIGGVSFSEPISTAKNALNYGRYDYWIVKINTNGNKVWDKSFGGTDHDYLSSIATTSDGGFLLGGSSESSSSPSGLGNKTAPNYGSTDYWVVKIK